MRRHPRLALEALDTRVVPAAVAALDPSFGVDGRVILPGVPLNAVAVQPDGRVVVAGRAAGDFFVARYTPDGDLDSTFGAGGVRVIDFGGTDTARALALQPDGRIVVVGGTDAGTGDFAVARLNPDGSPDTAFDGDGRLTVDFGGVDAARAVALLPNGRIFVVGGTDAGTGDFAVARLNPLVGDLDPTFDGDGRLTVDVTGGADVANAVVALSDLGVIVAGSGAGDIAVVRLRGAFLEDAFDGDGKRLLDFGGDDTANALAVQPDGRVLVAGTSVPLVPFSLPTQDFAVARFDPLTGAADPGFGAGGQVRVDRNQTGDSATSVTVLPGGRILVAGSDTTDMAFARLTPDGAKDLAFNGTGTVVLDASPALDVGTAAALVPGGRVIAVGFDQGGTDGRIIRGVFALDADPLLATAGPPDGAARVFSPDLTGAFGATPAAVSAAGVAGPVRAATADVNGDFVPDTVLVTGPGTALRVAVVSGTDGSTLLVPPFDPFGDPNFTGGGFVAAADLDNDGRAEFVVTPDQGGGPRVSVFSLPFGATAPTLRANFLGIDDANFRGGARAAVGDVDGDGFAELIVAAGFGGGPRTAIFRGQSVTGGSPARLVGDFFAFPGSDAVNLRNGSFVAAGDVDGDGFADLIFGGGPGGAPRVFILDGQQVSAGNVAGAQAAPVANFFVAGNTDDRGGVRVAAKDADGDAKADVAVGSGEGSPARVRVYLGANFTTAAEPTMFQDVGVFGGAALAGGVFVG